MDPLRNPFSPGAGSPPPELAGRKKILDKALLALARIKLGRSEKSLLMVGLRGVGKTVLLNRIAEIAEEQGYQAIMVEAHEQKTLPELLIPRLRELLFKLDSLEGLSEKVKRGLRVLKSFISTVKMKTPDGYEYGLDIDPERGVADSGDIEADLAQLFVVLGEAAKDRSTAIAIIIDEMQYLKKEELSALIMAVHRISQKALPLIVFGAGLPQLRANAGNAKSYAERLFDYPSIEQLDADDARDVLKIPVQSEGVFFEESAIEEVLRVTERYPYFLQEWGYQAWNVAQDHHIDFEAVSKATDLSLQRLDESFFRVRFDRLTPREKEYLRALAELGNGLHRSVDVADALGRDLSRIAPLRATLIHKGMLYSPRYGDLAFTVPLFGEFMKRIMPTFEKKEVK